VLSAHPVGFAHGPYFVRRFALVAVPVDDLQIAFPMLPAEAERLFVVRVPLFPDMDREATNPTPAV